MLWWPVLVPQLCLTFPLLSVAFVQRDPAVLASPFVVTNLAVALAISAGFYLLFRRELRDMRGRVWREDPIPFEEALARARSVLDLHELPFRERVSEPSVEAFGKASLDFALSGRDASVTLRGGSKWTLVTAGPRGAPGLEEVLAGMTDALDVCAPAAGRG